MGQDPSQIRNEIEQTRDQMGDTVDALAHKADVPGRVRETISDKTERFRQQMRSTAGSVGEATPDAGDVKQGAREAVGVAQENPLGLALGGVAFGFLVGMALPSTRVEDDRLGPMADDVKDQVRQTGQEAFEHGKQVAQDTAHAATEAARETAEQSGQEHAEDLRSSMQGDGAPDGGQSDRAPEGGQSDGAPAGGHSESARQDGEPQGAAGSTPGSDQRSGGTTAPAPSGGGIA